MEINLEQAAAQARTAAVELLDAAGLRPGDIFVVGCSSSEVLGGRIGKASSREAAEAVFSGIYPAVRDRGVWLAAQCCEHLNRALIVEGACAEEYGLDPGWVGPLPWAGGGVATRAWQAFDRPTAVERIRAHAGMDIGGTLIGMHLREVAVPVRLSVDHVGQAVLLCARTRPKYIGGVRAVYE